MHILVCFLLVGMAAALGPRPAAGQGVGIGASVHAGSLGLGARMSTALFGSPLRLRAGFELSALGD